MKLILNAFYSSIKPPAVPVWGPARATPPAPLQTQTASAGGRGQRGRGGEPAVASGSGVSQQQGAARFATPGVPANRGSQGRATAQHAGPSNAPAGPSNAPAGPSNAPAAIPSTSGKLRFVLFYECV